MDSMATVQAPALAKKERSSNLELYRIIVMLLIVAHHYVVNSGLTWIAPTIYESPLSPAALFLFLFGAWGKIGINCFVLISGYFMCKSQITVKKFVKLLCEIEFYRIIIYGVFLVMGKETLSLANVVRVLFPVTSLESNFTACYLIFFLCIPFLNVMVRNLSERAHIRLLLLSVFVHVLVDLLPLGGVTSNYVSWFIVLYFIASYIRLHPKRLFDNTAFWGWAALSSVLLSSASVILGAVGTYYTGRAMAYMFVVDCNAVLAVATGVSTFMFFKNVRVKPNRFINTVAASTFGVFCIHSNSEVMRRWLWQSVLKNVKVWQTEWMVVHAIVSVLGIFAVCTLIDWLRIKLIETPLMKVWDKLWARISPRLKGAEDKICKRLHIEN